MVTTWMSSTTDARLCLEAFAFTHLRMPATGVSKHIYNLSKSYMLLFLEGYDRKIIGTWEWQKGWE